MKRESLLLSAVLACGAAAFGDIRSVTPKDWDGKPDSWQMKRHASKMKEVENGGARIVFIGDSITHYWETEKGAGVLKSYFTGDRKMLNLGTSADRTEHVLWRITEGGELDGYEAAAVHIMVGTNNTGHNNFSKEPPSDTILGIRKILQIVREKQPKALVVLSAIFPRGETAEDSMRRRNETVNAQIRKFCDGKNVVWCDLTDDFLDAGGDLPADEFPDHLHPAASGYEKWLAAVKPYLEYALAGRNGDVPPEHVSVRPTAATRPEGVPEAAWGDTRIRKGSLGGKDGWLDRLLANRNKIAASGGAIDLVLAGDSITHFWESKGKEQYKELTDRYSVLNCGYSGDRTQHLLWRLQNGELEGYKAKCVMLMIGTNNAGHDRPEDVAAGIRKILDTIAEKQPGARTILLPVFPRGASATDRLRVENEKTNKLIKEFADGDKVVWIDFNSRLTGAGGDVKDLMPDRLHPEANGYKIWLDATLGEIEKACAATPSPAKGKGKKK